MDTIFVALAPYRDDELVRTVESAVVQASNPECLRFGVLWQYDEWTADDLGFLDDDRFRVSDVYYRDSLGDRTALARTGGRTREALAAAALGVAAMFAKH